MSQFSVYHPDVIAKNSSEFSLAWKRFLRIKVNSSEENGAIIENTLVSESDEVHSGIPLDYSEEILKRSEELLNKVDCSAGTITFDIGGHGYIGSSASIFGLASEILLKLLINNNKNDIHGIERLVYNQLNP